MNAASFTLFGNLPRFFFTFQRTKILVQPKIDEEKKIICKLNNQRDDDNKWIIDQKRVG